MIQIEIQESPDFDAQGTRTYFFNEIYIGNKRGNVIVGDDKLIDNQFKIEVNESKIIGSIHPDLKTFLLNGKISQGKINLKVGDKISIGKSLIVLKAAVYEASPSYKETTNANLEALIAKKDPLLDILKKIEKVANER